MKKFLTIVACIIALSACNSVTKEKLGMTKKAPNEFMVSSKAPLTMPPGTELNPVPSMPSVQPKIILENVSSEEAKFVSKFSEPTAMAKIDAISEAIDKELQRFGKNV